MAGHLAEYDDDGSFGDFVFAAYPDNKTINARPGNQISSGNDDDWGDFVDNSTQMNGGDGLSNGHAHTQSLSEISDFANAFDPFGVSLDSKERNEPHVPQPSRFDSGPTKSTEHQSPKPNGALPLSIFGEDEDREEEEKSGAVEPTFGGGTNFFSNKNGSSENRRSSLNNGIEINDLIANLYNQSIKAQAENQPSVITSGSIVNSFGSKSDDDIMVPNSSFQGLGTNGPDLNSNQINSELAVKTEGDEEEDGWEFKSAETEILKEDGSYQGVAVRSVHDVSESGQASSKYYDFSNWASHRADFWNSGFESIPRARSQNNLTSEWNAEGKLKNAGDGKIPVNGLKNTFPESNTLSGKSQGLDFALDFDSGFLSLDGCALDSIKTEQDDIMKGLSWSPVHENGNSSTLRTSEDSAAEIGQKPGVNRANLNSLKEALPDSLFGIENPQTNGSLECQETSMFEPSFDMSRKTILSPKLSVNHLISTLNNPAEEKSSANHTLTFGESERDFFSAVLDPHRASDDDNFLDDSWEFKYASSGAVLYSQAEQSSPANDTPNPCDTGLQSSVLDNNLYVGCNTSWEVKEVSFETRSRLSSQIQWDISNSSADVAGSDLVEFVDDFGDDSWEFKDASSAISLSIASSDVSIKLELPDYTNLYSKLIEQLYYSSLNRLEDLKKAQNLAAFSSGVAEAAALDEEIKEFSDALSQCEIISQRQSADHAPQNFNLHGLVEMLKEPKYQAIESEYQLSSRLEIAEKDFRSAVALLKHVASTLRILNLKSREEQSNYLAMWTKIVSVCSHELKHGANIWKQSLVNHVDDLILSTHQGKQYIHALGEIFRVVEIIGASAKMYKPWILVGSGETRSLLASLNECSVIWSSSGLEDALERVMVNLEQERAQTKLFESIKYIHDLDESALQNQVMSPTLPKCRMSALPLVLLPGLKTVEWEGENYLLNLANLWANLVSPDPLKS